ncbi:MAG: TetR/AcrR family transcriptional regulator [Rhodobiaceae bacterium]|nr:TetR/AcrR family transcriptional regulator [Rhodobiaceae bacterium]
MRKPTQERARKRVADILAATAELVSQGGVEAVTTTDVADKAGVPVGSIYQYFEDANDILRTVQSAYAAELVAACHEVLDGLPPDTDWQTATRRSFDTYWKELLKRPVYVALLRDATRTQSFADTLGSEVPGGLGRSDLGALFLRSLNVGGATLPPAKADAVTDTVLGSLSALTDLAMLIDDGATRETRREEMLRMIQLYLEDTLRP